jgi:hypothetical protein
MRMRQLIVIQFIIVIVLILAKDSSAPQFSQIYYLVAISLYFSLTFYLILDLKHLQQKHNRKILEEFSKQMTDLKLSFYKVQFFIASQTSELHLKKLGGWALDIDTAQLLTRIVKIASPINVLEFGSGTSTVILGRSLSELPKSLLFSVDESTEYLSETRKFLKLNKLNNVKLVHAPLQDNWYSLGPLEFFRSSI